MSARERKIQSFTLAPQTVHALAALAASRGESKSGVVESLVLQAHAAHADAMRLQAWGAAGVNAKNVSRLASARTASLFSKKRAK